MILRLEQYLARVAGETGAVPEDPETNTETYLAILAGENRQAPEPVTRLDMYLYNLIGGNYPIPTPNTRIEQYLAKACGLEIEVPTPITREEQLWYAIANPSWQLTTLTGALPLSFKSKGEALTDYKIYGTSDGAGVETESGEPTGYKLPMTTENGNAENLAPALSQWGNGYVSASGAIEYIALYYEEKFTTFIEIKPNAVYLFGIDGNAFPTGSNGAWIGIGLYDDKQHTIKRVTSTSTNPYTFSTPSNAKYVRLSYRSYGELWEPMLNERSFSTPIYIGDTKLGAEEYVDYESGKIYRDVDGTLTPTDPPAPLPEISTYEGENVISFDDGIARTADSNPEHPQLEVDISLPTKQEDVLYFFREYANVTDSTASQREVYVITKSILPKLDYINIHFWENGSIVKTIKTTSWYTGQTIAGMRPLFPPEGYCFIIVTLNKIPINRFPFKSTIEMIYKEAGNG